MIETEEEYEKALEEIQSMVWGNNETVDETKVLELLIAIENYEKKHYAI